MFNALEAYPQDVSLHTFCRKFDDHFGHPTSRTQVLIKPTPAITDETLQVDIRHFKDAPEDIRADTDVDTADRQTRSHGTHHRTRYQRITQFLHLFLPKLCP